MAHIFGKNISNTKKLVFGLTAIHGIGLKTAYNVCQTLNFDPNLTIGKLSESDILKITNFIQNTYLIESLLKREVSNNIKGLISIRNYRGIRHSLGLPVRGQRTCSNAKIQKKLAKLRYK